MFENIVEEGLNFKEGSTILESFMDAEDNLDKGTTVLEDNLVDEGTTVVDKGTIMLDERKIVVDDVVKCKQELYMIN